MDHYFYISTSSKGTLQWEAVDEAVGSRFRVHA